MKKKSTKKQNVSQRSKSAAKPKRSDVRTVSEDDLEDMAGGASDTPTKPWALAMAVQPMDWKQRFQAFLARETAKKAEHPWEEDDAKSLDDSIRSWAQAIHALPPEAKKRIKSFLDKDLKDQKKKKR